MLMDLDGASRLLVLRLLIIVSRFPFEHYTDAFVRARCKTFFLMKIWKELYSLLFLYVTNLMDMLFETSLAGKLCAFMLSFELKVNMCTAVCALKSMPLVKPPHDVQPCIWNYAFRRSPRAPFSQQCFFCSFFFVAVESGWVGRWGWSVGFYQYCGMLSARARPRPWIWTGTISGFSEVDIATSQITTALISAKNNAKKTLFFGINSVP